MKISACSFLSGCLLLLISTTAFSQDSTHPSVPVMPADSATPARKVDSIPVITQDSEKQAVKFQSRDSIHTFKYDSTQRQPKSIPRPPGVQGFSSGRRNGNNRQSPAIGHFYGRILDSKTSKGMDGTSVQLAMTLMDSVTHNRRDSVIRGTITPSNGNFSFEDLPVFGNFRLKITAIGYKPIDQRVAFSLKDAQNGDPEQRMGAVDKDLGNIKMEIDPTSLQQVTVTAEKPLIQLGIDRKVYNVEKDLSASGGTAADIMKNIPSLAVDIDGNVTLRNATPTIFVDGRPTTLTLDQIPADEIESVEIITNPGAKFDASGGISGILNIVMKKNRKPGYNGAVRAGFDKRGGYNVGGNINIKQGKVNVFASGNLNHRKSISPGTTDRLTFISNPDYQLHQADSNVNNGHFVFGRLGLDYFLDNRNTFSIAGTLVHGTSKPFTNSIITQDTLYDNGYSHHSLTQRYSNTSSEFNNKSGMVSYKHNFPRSGEEWTADANYSNGQSSSINKINSYVFNDPAGNLSNSYKQQQNANGKNEYITAQTDFTNPFAEKSKLETGARIAVRNIGSLNNFYTIDNTGSLTYQPLLSSNYNYHDQVLAGYIQYSDMIGKLGFQLGLRAENSTYHGTNSFAKNDGSSPGGLKDTLGSFSNNYPVSLFPSIYLTEKLTDDQDLQLNYTRRIDRPGFLQLTPFTDYSDSLNLSRGNPDLKPQFTNSVEMAYQLTYHKNTFLASVYYKYTTDLITRYQTKEINPLTDSVVLVNTFINANSSYVGGLELIGRNNLTSWWDLTTNLNIYTSKINTVDSIQTAPASYSWFAKINSTFKLPKNFTLQITGDYTSKTNLPPGGSASSGGQGGGGGRGGTVSGNAQGYSLPSGGVDASLKYEFLKNKAASLTFNINDIFATRRYDVFINSQYSNQHTLRYRDPRLFRIQFNYRFGKVDVSLFKRKPKQEEPDNPQNNTDTSNNQ